MTTRRRLIVMRHAKAQPFAATDHERVLTERGRRAALDTGLHLAGIGAVPDYALVSSAARAAGTWEGVAQGSRSVAEVRFDGVIYAGGPDVLLESLRAVPLDARVVMVVGHNPSVAYLAHLLDDSRGDPDALRGMARGFPAGALTVLDVGVPWSDLDAGTGTVSHFHVGRD